MGMYSCSSRLFFRFVGVQETYVLNRFGKDLILTKLFFFLIHVLRSEFRFFKYSLLESIFMAPLRAFLLKTSPRSDGSRRVFEKKEPLLRVNGPIPQRRGGGGCPFGARKRGTKKT